MAVLQELSQSLLNLNSGHSLPVLLQRMLAQKSRELQALVEINRSMAGSLDLEALLALIATETRRLLEFDGVAIRLIEGGTLIKAAQAGSGDLAPPSVALDGDESLGVTVVKENLALAINNVAHEATLAAGYLALLSEQGCQSVLGVPLRAGDRVIGAVVGIAKSQREFQPDEISLMTALADQAVIAFQNCTAAKESRAKADELRRTSQEFEEARRAKAKFISTVSHELRTPLQVIIGYADLLKDGVVGRSKQESGHVLKTIAQNAEMLDRLIGNVLALTKAEIKETALDNSLASIEAVIEQVRRYAERLRPNESIEFCWKIEKGLPPIDTDLAKLYEILQNLVANACNFTVEGKIEVRVANLRSRNRFEFSVADTGCGIGKNDREKIFDEFYQAKQAKSDRTGIGLGLSVVKKYLSLMQGEIAVESRLGKGATFTFTLPYSIS